MIVSGIDVFTVAKLAGTSVAMIERTYGHLCADRTRNRLDLVKMY
jgi:hypothetical protein